jgi:hypothetical protein
MKKLAGHHQKALAASGDIGAWNKPDNRNHNGRGGI